MRVETRPSTTPHGRRRLGNLLLPRRRTRGEDHGDVIVRVRFYRRGRSYAFVVRGPVERGSYVEVEGTFSGKVVRPVIGFGRAGYRGPLRRGRVVR